MEYSWRTIPIKALALDPAPYQITTRRSVEDLIASIKAVGLLQPIIVARQGPECVVLAGHRRVKACAFLGHDSITAGVVPETASRVEKAMIAVADNCSQRRLNLVEQARAVGVLSEALGGEDRLEDLAAGAGLPVNAEMIAKLKKVARMAPALQEALMAGAISLPIALRLYETDEATAVLLADLFTKMGIGLNRQRQILTWADEISKRDGVAVADILARVNAYGKDGIKNAKDKGAWTRAIIEGIRVMRYPSMVAAEKRFRQLLGKLKLPEGMRIDPPPYFEGNDYKVILTVRRKEDLERLGSDLQKLAAMKETAKILR